MDAEFPLAGPLDAPPSPPPDPAWTGPDVVFTILITLLAMVVFSAVAYLGWAIVAHATHITAAAQPERALVAIMLIAQTAGFAVGFLFAWAWINDRRGARFWEAIHWRKLRPEAILAILVGGMLTMIGVQILGHLLPMPSEVPMDRLFTSRTAWMLLIYGTAIAPFFEEFFFRGLIYPSLRATFRDGFPVTDRVGWRPVVRLLAALALVTVLLGLARTVVMTPWNHLAPGLYGAGAVICLALLVLPRLLLAPLGGLLHLLAQLHHPELLAILVTGILFGLMHAAQLGWAWAAVLILVLVGIVLTVVRAVTGSLMASWLFHVAYNGTLFAVQLVATQGFHHFTQGPH